MVLSRVRAGAVCLRCEFDRVTGARRQWTIADRYSCTPIFELVSKVVGALSRGAFGMAKYLNQKQIDEYRRDGFVAPVDVMSAQQAGEYLQALEQAEKQWPTELSGQGRNNPHLCFSFFDELTHHSRILDAVEDLIGPDVLVCGSVLFAKDAGDDAFVSFHQDVTYMGLEPHDGVSAWLALTPSNRDNGCMRMIPGSHRGPLKPHRDTDAGNNILTRGQTIEEADASLAVDIELEAGQMSLHSLKTIHDSKPNHSNDRRIGFTIQSFIPPHVRQANGLMHVQLARGTDTQNLHPHVARVDSTMSDSAVANRDKVNSQWAEILYKGTQHTRRF